MPANAPLATWSIHFLGTCGYRVKGDTKCHKYFTKGNTHGEDAILLLRGWAMGGGKSAAGSPLFRLRLDLILDDTVTGTDVHILVRQLVIRWQLVSNSRLHKV